MGFTNSDSLDDSTTTVNLVDKEASDRSWSSKLVSLGDYQIERELGRGGMGIVYLATEKGLSRKVALKALPTASRISSMQVRRFLLEARAAAQLSHDHIVPIYHIDQQDGIHYFTMRLIEGHDLAQVLQSARQGLKDLPNGSTPTPTPSASKPEANQESADENKDTAVSIDTRIDLSVNSFAGSLRSSSSRPALKLAVSVALIGQAVAEALHHAHQNGIVHRDIKPSNLMMDHTNKVWVTDFGLAQLQDSPGLTNSGDILGTLRYMSPEQATGRRSLVDHRTDIYSLGVTLYELATLRRACRGETPQEILRSITFDRPHPIRKINRKLPRDLETIICKATERNPNDRYTTAAEFAADLRRFANSDSLVARRPSRVKRFRDWMIERPALATMGLAIILMFSVSAVLAALAANEGRLAEQKRAVQAEAVNTEREAQLLQSAAASLRDENPGLALGAVMESAEVLGGPITDQRVMSIVDGLHELRTIPLNFQYPGACVTTDDGTRVLICNNVSSVGKSKQRALVQSLSADVAVGEIDSDVPILSASFFADDNYLLTNSPSGDALTQAPQPAEVPLGNLRVWDAKTLKLKKAFPLSDARRVSSENYSRNNLQLVLPNAERSATVFNVPSFSQAMVLPTVHAQPVLESSYSADGTKIATWGSDSLAVVWDSKTGQQTRQIKYECDRPVSTSVYFTADSSQLLISGDRGTRIIDLRDPTSMEHPRREKVAHVSQKNNLAYFVQGFPNSSILVFNTEHRTVVAECKADTPIITITPLKDDRYVAAILDEVIAVFDTRTGQRITDLCGHQDYIQSVAPAGNGSQLASVGLDGTLRLWDVHSDLERRTFSTIVQTTADVPAIAVQSPNGSSALLGNIRFSESSVRMIGQPQQSKDRLEGEVLLVLSDGKVLTSFENNAAIWDLGTVRKVNAISVGSDTSTAILKAIELKESGAVVLLSSDGQLHFWALGTNHVTRHPLNSDKAYSLALSHEGDELLVGLASGELIALDRTSWSRKSITFLPQAPVDLDLHPERNILLITGSLNQAFLWDLDKSELITKLGTSDARVAFARFVAGERVLTHGELAARSIDLWNAADGTHIDSHAVKHVFDAALNSDRTRVAVAAHSGTVYWDLANNEKVDVHHLPSKSVGFLGNKLVIATGRFNPPPVTEPVAMQSTNLMVWNIASRNVISADLVTQHITRIRPLDSEDRFLVSSYAYGVDYVDVNATESKLKLVGHLQPLLLAAFGSDTNRAITVSTDGNILEHSLTQGDSTSVGMHAHPITAASISSDRKLLLAADTANGVRHWDLTTQQVVREISTHGTAVKQLLISSANTTALAVIEGGLIKHWDLRTGHETDYTIEAGVRNVALSPDGQFILVAAGNIEVFPAHPLYAAEAIQSGQQQEVQVIGLNPPTLRKIQVDGLPVGCQFVDSGKTCAVLNTKGVVELFSLATLEPQQAIAGQRRFMQLLESPAASQSVFTAAKNRIAAWNVSDAKLLVDVGVSMNEYAAAVTLPNDFLRNSNSPNYILFSERRFFKRPVDAIGYAREIAPRQLTDQERSRLLGTPVRK